MLAAALALASAPAMAQWSMRELPAADGSATGYVATALAYSGNAALQIGCSPEGMPFVSLEYLGYDSEATALQVRYRVDGRNPIQALWPRQAAYNSLLVTNSNPVFVEEFARRAALGARMLVQVEVLPELWFGLRGSRDAIDHMHSACAVIPPPPPDGTEEGEEPADGEAPGG